MEEDKNKRNKRNKKKRNRQTAKPTDIAALDARESNSDIQNNLLERGEDNNGRVSGPTNELGNVGGWHRDAGKDGALANCFEGENLGKFKEHCSLDGEASFLNKIKELLADKDALMQKEASLEEKIKQLQKEKDENSQKEASQLDKIQQLQDEKSTSMKNEANLKQKLVQLEKEKSALLQNLDNLEEKNQHLLLEMDAYQLKEANLRTIILRLEMEKDLWIQKEVTLQEKIRQMENERDSWILSEESTKESIANLTNDKAQLRAQVIELEQVRGALSKDKAQLEDIISSLRLQTTHLESSSGLLLCPTPTDKKVTSEEEMKYKTDGANGLVDKLVAENSELFEKVNELHAEVEERGSRSEHFSPAGSVHGGLNAPGDGSNFMPQLAVDDDWHRTQQAIDSISEVCKMMSLSSSNQSLEDVMVKEERDGAHVNLDDGYEIGITSSEIIEGDEIVQIPLDENEVVLETNVEVAHDDENTDVPLTDAPLIGAPFRFIATVARYVSGADLVNKNAGRSG